MSNDVYGERRLNNIWRGLHGTYLKCPVLVPQVPFPSMISGGFNRGMNETCKPTPEASASNGRRSACVQGHVNLAETDGRHWRNVNRDPNPPCFERELGNCKTEDLDVHISQRQIPIGAFYPSMVHAEFNTTSPFSSESNIIPRVDLQLRSNNVNWPHVTDTSTSIIYDQRSAVEKKPSGVPLTAIHQTSLYTDYRSPVHDYTRTMQQSGNLNVYPFRYERVPYIKEGDLATDEYPYSRNYGGVTEDTFCTALKNNPVAWDNCGTQLRGVHYSCDVASAHKKPASLHGTDLNTEACNEDSSSNLRDMTAYMDFQLFQRSRSQSPNGVRSQSSSLSASPQRSDSQKSDSYSSGSPGTHRRQSSSSCSTFSKRMKANKDISVRKSVEKGSKNLQNLLLFTLDKGSKGSQSSSQRQCKSKTSHSSRSRSHSLTPVSQSGDNYLPGRSRNSSQSRSQSPRGRASLSRRWSSRKSDSPLCRSSLRRKRSSSSETDRSPRVRSRKHYRITSKSSHSSRSRRSPSSRSRSLTPHRKDRHSSQKEKSLNHPLGLPEGSDEDTAQGQFGVKVKFCTTDLDDKSVKDNIFRLFYKFGFVTHVEIINSGSERFALVYFSRPHEQQAAVYCTGHAAFCGKSMRVSLWTEKEQDELQKQLLEAKLNQGVKSDADYGGSGIFWENNIQFHPSSSRTLLISKLPKSIAPEKLDMICEKFDNIVDFDVEKTPGKSTCSALVEFTDIVSLVKAGKELNRQFFGIDGVQLGFAELKPTNCLWVDGLPPSLSSEILMLSFVVYGPIAKMLHDRLLCRALILYKQNKDALFAVKQTKLRQANVFGRLLMLDFASDRSQLAFCQTMQECGQDVGNFLHE